MKSLGMKITAEDIYSTNHSSLKDAVVQFGSGCTGEIVSPQGLLLTNHHCASSQIQSLSTISRNYLKDGFWADSQAEEIACPGLTATFIIEIRDVTAAVQAVLTDSTSDDRRDATIKILTDSLEKAAINGTHYKAFTRAFYQGNQYYLFITEVFKDIRLVGAPPVSVGHFGGETDNWMWPRHTGDFAVFRIYAGKDNAPADYSKDNVPFIPRHFFPVNIGGVKEGDFTFVMGFPGRTNAYLPAAGLELVLSQTNPDKISCREERLKIWREAMSFNDTIQLKYASKYRTLANYYKKWKGEIHGLKKTEALAAKKKFENEFMDWLQADSSRITRYGRILPEFEEFYSYGKPYSLANDFLTEGLLGIEIVGLANRLLPLVDLSEKKEPDEKAIEELRSKLVSELGGTYRNYDAPTDEKVCAAMLRLCMAKMSKARCPLFFETIRTNYHSDCNRYAKYLFEKTIFASPARLRKFLVGFRAGSVRKLKKDPAWKLAAGISDFQKSKVEPDYTFFTRKVNSLQRLYMQALLEMKKEEILYPDANSTFRVSYGIVDGMSPADGVRYEYTTTLDGLISKEDTSSEEFQVPSRLKQLVEQKDYGEFASNGTVPVAFLASNHTTNGNSGSPVLNAKGELVGINFDRIWEGVMSDLYYDEEVGRNITVDIRYVLFFIEKFAGAHRLLEEMRIVR